jgi:hypothetical protein
MAHVIRTAAEDGRVRLLNPVLSMTREITAPPAGQCLLTFILG